LVASCNQDTIKNRGGEGEEGNGGDPGKRGKKKLGANSQLAEIQAN